MRGMRRRLAVALFTGIATSAAAAPPDPNAPYKELVSAYAAGNRATAVAGLGALDEDALRAGAASLAGQPPGLLLAALMLHTDRRLLERGTPETPETIPVCTSAHVGPSLRLAQQLVLDVSGTEIARAWLVAIALQDRWDGCFEDAFRWIDAAARWFPADSDVLLTRAMAYETFAALPLPLPRASKAVGMTAVRTVQGAAADRLRHLGEARRSLERALAADARLGLARLRLGRVLWRLREGDAARAALERVIAEGGDDALVHLAHLFVARVHVEEGRLDPAIASYRAALDLHPSSQAAAIGLADALQLAGEPEEARARVEAALARAGRGREMEPFWEYVFGDARRAPERLERLRDRASGRP